MPFLRVRRLCCGVVRLRREARLDTPYASLTSTIIENGATW
jgi:hypothetical protein